MTSIFTYFRSNLIIIFIYELDFNIIDNLLKVNRVNIKWMAG